jgi:formylglycine-generating enzyme required for sulfatase activity
MGNAEGDPTEYPPHAVTLSGYCIDQTEVTVKAYGACVAAGKCSAADLKVSRYCNRGDRPAHPVNCVDRDQAAAYCKWVDKRLPTEAEWEYAARGADGRKYPWGNEAPSAKRLNACGSECVAMVKRDEKQQSPAMYTAADGWETTAPVGSFPASASPFGVLDMAGNVWEWTADWFSGYSGTAATNPQGPTAGATRVFRGGGWGTFWADQVSTSHRVWEMPAYSNEMIGFRCARGE